MRRLMLQQLSRVTILGLLLLPLSGCPQQKMKFDSLNHRHRLMFAACRHDVKRELCPDDPDCHIKTAEKFAQEPAHSRTQWLIDFGCPRDKVEKVHDMVEKGERKSTGTN
jgi:hypothetical protein